MFFQKDNSPDGALISIHLDQVTEKKMVLTILEQAILSKFFEIEGFKIENVNLEQIQVVERQFTGIGFISQLNPKDLKIVNGSQDFIGGTVGAKLNGKIDAGFLVYVKNSYIDALEGYTYGEDWPEIIETFELYLMQKS